MTQSLKSVLVLDATMKKWVVLLVILLFGCSSPEQRPVQKEEIVQEVVLPPAPVLKQDLSEPVARTVMQSGSLGAARYGLSDDYRLLKVEKTGSTWDFFYENGHLVEIKGPKNMEFSYSGSFLESIDVGSTKYQFKYDSRSRLVEVRGGPEPLYFDYDSIDQIRAVRRGVAGKTSIDYDKQGKIKYLTRGKITTNVIFDDKDRLRNFDADDTKLILGYWRDDKLISLSGKTFGSGLTVSYGPDYPPDEAKIISAVDKSVFTSGDMDALYTVLDEYVYCRYARTLKEVLFEGISYSLFVNYLKGGMADYLKMQFVCLAYES